MASLTDSTLEAIAKGIVRKVGGRAYPTIDFEGLPTEQRTPVMAAVAERFSIEHMPVGPVEAIKIYRQLDDTDSISSLAKQLLEGGHPDEALAAYKVAENRDGMLDVAEYYLLHDEVDTGFNLWKKLEIDDMDTRLQVLAEELQKQNKILEVYKLVDARTRPADKSAIFLALRSQIIKTADELGLGDDDAIGMYRAVGHTDGLRKEAEYFEKNMMRGQDIIYVTDHFPTQAVALYAELGDNDGLKRISDVDLKKGRLVDHGNYLAAAKYWAQGLLGNELGDDEARIVLKVLNFDQAYDLFSEMKYIDGLRMLGDREAKNVHLPNAAQAYKAAGNTELGDFLVKVSKQ